MRRQVETIEGGCLLCGGDVKGNETYKFYCKKCNVLFERWHLARRKEMASKEPAPAKEEPYRLPAGVKYIASHHSDKYHKLGCRYVDQIQGANLKHFKSGIEAERKGYKACVCVRK
jgi:hypothetical protein